VRRADNASGNAERAVPRQQLLSNCSLTLSEICETGCMDGPNVSSGWSITQHSDVFNDKGCQSLSKAHMIRFITNKLTIR